MKSARKDLKDNCAILNKKLLDSKVAVEQLQSYKATKIAEEKHLARKSKKKLLKGVKKYRIEDTKQNNTCSDDKTKEETKYIPNIPVSNLFNTLETDATKHVDENLNFDEGVERTSEKENKIEENEAFLKIKCMLLECSKSVQQYCLETSTMSKKEDS